MYEANTVGISKNTQRVFNLLLLLYPKQYRKKFGQEIWFAFEDLCQEELTKKGNVGIRFWFVQIFDMFKSIIEQHVNEINEKGMKKYLQQTLHLNTYNIIGGVLLLPVFLVFCIDLISRIVQGDLVHYNRPVYSLLSHTPLYWYPVLFTWIIIFPLVAVLVNIIPLIKNINKNNGRVKSTRFILQNLLTMLLLGFGAFIILLVKFHDVGPCMLHGLARLGFEHFTHIIAVCKNA